MGNAFRMFMETKKKIKSGKLKLNQEPHKLLRNTENKLRVQKHICGIYHRFKALQ